MYTNSIIDQDLYKFTTSYAYMKMFPPPKRRGHLNFMTEIIQNILKKKSQKLYKEYGIFRI